jgi:hypothetical protein
MTKQTATMYEGKVLLLDESISAKAIERVSIVVEFEEAEHKPALREDATPYVTEVTAVYEGGTILKLSSPLPFEPNTRFKITIHPFETETESVVPNEKRELDATKEGEETPKKTRSFLTEARGLIEGDPDGSTRQNYFQPRLPSHEDRIS